MSIANAKFLQLDEMANAGSFFPEIGERKIWGAKAFVERDARNLINEETVEPLELEQALDWTG